MWGCVGHGLPPPWWAWCFAASYWWLSRLDVGAKIGGPVKGVPASSLAGEDEGGGRCADTRLAVGRLARSLGVRRQVRGHGVVREPTLKAQATLG